MCTCGESGTWAECEAEYCDPIDPSKYMGPPKGCVKDWYDGCNFRDCEGN